MYYSYHPRLIALRGPLTLRWTVLDLPHVAKEGRQIAAERNAIGLDFVVSSGEVPDFDILLASGSVHYWEQSIPEFVKQFPKFPTHILINRTPILDDASSFVTVQKRESYAVPCIVRNAAEVIADFSALGYTLVDRWRALELALRLPLFPEHSVPHYSGFYFRRDLRQ